MKKILKEKLSLLYYLEFQLSPFNVILMGILHTGVVSEK